MFLQLSKRVVHRQNHVYADLTDCILSWSPVSTVSSPQRQEQHGTRTPSRVHAATLLRAFSFTALFPSSFFLGQGLNYSYSTSGFYLGQGLNNTLLTTRLDSSPSSSTPPHPIRIHTRSRHELRSVTDRLTGPDHEEQSSLAGSPRMQPHCACSGKAVNKWVSWGLRPHPLPASPPFSFISSSEIIICLRLPPFMPHPYPSWE